MDDDPQPQPDKEEEIINCSRREFEWLLESILPPILKSAIEGLNECLALIADDGPSSTLPLSSAKSESLKGVVSRIGTLITKTDIQIKLGSLNRGHTFKLSSSDSKIQLYQLDEARDMIAQALSLCHLTLQTAARCDKVVENEILIVVALIRNAKSILCDASGDYMFPSVAITQHDIDTPLPSNLSISFSISESSVVADIRVLDIHPRLPVPPKPADTALGSRSSSSNSLFTLGAEAMGKLRFGRKSGPPKKHEIHQYRGVDVATLERVCVGSIDPSLIALMAKLSAMEQQIFHVSKLVEAVTHNV